MIVQLDKRHVEDASHCLADMFCRGEPLTKFLCVPYDVFYSFVKPVVENIIESGLSLASYAPTGKLSGVLLMDKFSSNSAKIPNDYAQLLPILKLLKELEDAYRKVYKDFVEKTAHIHMTATYPDDPVALYKLVKHATKICTQRGFSKIFVEATNSKTSETLKKFSWCKPSDIPPIFYAKYKIKEQFPFLGMPEDLCCDIWIKDLE